MKPSTQKDIRNKLKEVLDPELFLSIVDLGLVYNIQIEDTTAIITMTLTTIGCPLFDTIQNDIHKAVLTLPDIKEVKVELTFDPPWDYDKMSESAKTELGID
jgi:metal-sulfur cluster biosynthetic enzyme